MYYTKNAKDTHSELMENVLGCYSKQTATIQKEAFKSIIKDSFGADEKKADKVFMDVQENLNNMIEEYNEMYDDTDSEPITLKDKDIQSLLIESGVPEELTTKIEKSYKENFGDDIPLAENLIDSKVLKENEQRKKEEHLKKQVEILQTRLEEVKQEVAAGNKTEDPSSTEVSDTNEVLGETSESNAEETLETDLEENKDTNSEDNKANNDYDVILQVKPEKIPQIKSEVIDGQKCIVIPINEDEQTKVNGLDDLI